MNELLYQNASSIPSKHIVIPAERLFGAHKPGFGSSEFRLNQKDPQQIVNLLRSKYKNLSKTSRSRSMFEEQNSKTQQERDNEAKQKQQLNSAEKSKNKFSKPVSSSSRMHIPSHKMHYIQLINNAQNLPKPMEVNANLNQNNTSNNHSGPSSSSVNKTSKTRIMKSSIAKIVKDQLRDSNEINAYEIVKEANNEFLRDFFKLSEDLTKENNVSKRYKQTHKSAFSGSTRDNILKVYEMNKFHPGPGDYDVNRLFDGQNSSDIGSQHNQQLIKERRAISMKQQGQEQYQEQFEAAKEGTVSYIKVKLAKALGENSKNNNNIITIDKEADKDKQPIKNITKNSSNNQSYIFAKDDRDRFGQQIYPLSTQFPVPGPGKYDQNQFTVNKKIQAIQTQEEQKQLLKVWLHPMKEDEKDKLNRTKKDWKFAKNTQYRNSNNNYDPQGPIHLKHYG